MECVKGYNLEILRSNAGYYIGTLDEENMPNCRMTEGYAKTRKDVLSLKPRHSFEIQHCSNGNLCVNFDELLKDIKTKLEKEC